MGSQIQNPETASLGNVITVHRARRPGFGQIAIRLVLFLLLIGLPVLYGLQLGYYGFTHYGLTAAATWSLPWILAGGFLFLILLTGLILQRRNTRRFVSVHQNGIRILFSGGRERFFRWKQLSGILFECTQAYLIMLPLPPRNRLSIVPISGRTIRFDDQIEGIDELSQEIKDRYYPLAFPPLLRQYHAGQLLPFGPLSLEKKGLKINKKRIGWDEVEDIQILKGFLTIHLHSSKPIKIPIGRIPNPELFLKLANERKT